LIVDVTTKTPLQLQSDEDINIIYRIYEKYTSVSGLKTNYRKSSALYINTSVEVRSSIENSGIPLENETDCLGIILGKTIEECMTKTMSKIEPRAIQRQILATAHPVNMLHKSILLNIAVQPIFNHVFMALPFYDDATKNFLMKYKNSCGHRKKKILPL